jgi:hypothetical protein
VVAEIGKCPRFSTLNTTGRADLLIGLNSNCLMTNFEETCLFGRVKKVEISSTTKLKQLRPAFYEFLRKNRSKIDGRSYEKYADVAFNSNKKKILEVYDAIRGIETSQNAKPITFKKVKEFKEQKIAAIKAIQKAVRTRVIKPYWLIDILLYRLATKDDDGTAAKRVVRYGQAFIQYNSAFQLSVKESSQKTTKG